MHTSHLAGRDALQAVAGDLDALLGEVHAPVTARRRWLQCWVDAHPDVEPWVVAARDERGGLAAAALLARRRVRGIVRVTGLGHGFSDRSRAFVARGPACADALARAVSEALAALRGPWSLTVEQLPVGDPVASRLGAMLPRGRVVPGDGCPVLYIDDRDPRSYSTKKTRRDVSQARRRLEEEGLAMEVSLITDPEELVGAIPEVIELRRARDHALGRRSHLDDPSRRAFYSDVVRAHAEEGIVELVLVSIDGALAAFDLSFCDGSSYRLWDGRIATDFARFSPGHLSRDALLARVVPDPAFTELDWMRGEQAYKRQLATVIESTWLLQAWSSPTTQFVSELPTRTRELVARASNSYPLVNRALAFVKRHTLLRKVTQT